MVFGMMLAGGLIAGGVMAHYATKDRYKSMAREQEQQEQLQQAQAQAEEAERAAEQPSCKRCRHRQEDLTRTRMMLFINSKN